jgi:hypothetical protein
MIVSLDISKEDFALLLATLCQVSMNRPVTGPRLLKIARQMFNNYAETAHPFDADLMREDVNEVHLEQWSKV